VTSGGMLGRYRLDTLVSRGGMGEVWQAFDETLGRTVAIKLLYEELGEPVVRERFMTEARAIARLDHPNIVAIYDIGDCDGRPYLVMELLEGRTVADELAEHGQLPVSEVRDIGAQTAAGLSYAHQAGVVHRDVKPDNLVLTADRTVKLVDFGLARLLEDNTPRLTPAGTAMGTLAYISPETAMDADVDGRSDLYSLGCVLYELLCGRPPFVGRLPVVAYAHVRTAPDPPSRYRSDIPPDLEAIVMSLLAKDPEFRPADGDAVRNCLLGLADPPAVPAAPRVGRARRRPILAAAGALVAASVLVAAAWWTDGEPNHRAVEADNEQPRSTSSALVSEPEQESQPRGQDAVPPDVAAGAPAKVRPESHHANDTSEPKSRTNKGEEQPDKSPSQEPDDTNEPKQRDKRPPKDKADKAKQSEKKKRSDKSGDDGDGDGDDDEDEEGEDDD
jgi:serine/threonine protein kinase